MPDVLHRLAALLPADRFLTRPEQLAAYESDALTAFRTRPLAIAIPETTDEVVGLVRFCHKERLPFVARGSGTSLSGGSLPVADGIVIALNRLTRILRLDPAQRLRGGGARRGQHPRFAGRRAARTSLRARPVERADLHDWRQCRLQLRRCSLPQVRHDGQPHSWHQSGAPYRRGRRMGRPEPGEHWPGLVWPFHWQRGPVRHCPGDHAAIVAES